MRKRRKNPPRRRQCSGNGCLKGTCPFNGSRRPCNVRELKHGNYPPYRGEHPEIASWPIKLRNLARDIHHHPARYEHYLLEALMDMRLHQDEPGPDQPGAGSTGQPAIRMDVEGAPTPQIPQIIVMRSLPSEVAFALIGADPQLVEAISQLPEADQNRIVDVLASILVSEGIDYARRNPDFPRSAAAEQERRRQQREERRRRPRSNASSWRANRIGPGKVYSASGRRCG